MLQLFSPAKINLFLRIVSKRPDGYHNLSSLFQTISLGDTLDIKRADRDYLTCSDPNLPVDGSNLVMKAIELFRKKTGLNIHFHIHLDKRIPTQAGLGGGSSNAATTLWGCNELAGTKIPLAILQHWGGEIGSDIPFFFSFGSAYCTGRGEIVANIPPPGSRSLWIVKPAGGLSTPEVYRRFKLSSSSAALHDLENYLAGTLPLFNDLETPAFEIEPRLKQLKGELLGAGFNTALMSGSGSAFFCMGKGKVPIDPHLTQYLVQFCHRPADQWYAQPMH